MDQKCSVFGEPTCPVCGGGDGSAVVARIWGEHAMCHFSLQSVKWCTSLKEHDEEMRWLAELFSLEELANGSIPDEVADLELGEWCVAHPDDARALRYLAVSRGDELVMEKAAWATLG